MRYLLLILYLLFTSSGLVLMKLGTNTGTMSFANLTFSFSINFISLCGLLLYIISFLLFTKIIIAYDLSFIFPILTGITQIISLAAALIIFKEKITIYGVIGIVMIIAGIVIMNISKANH